MPQIRCPNCGTSIDLESRRNTDFNLIVGALKEKSRTFTELLKMTYLPRKTLSLRLKELIKSGVIVKDRGYHLNGASPSKEWTGKLKTHLTFDTKHVLLLLLVFIIGMPVGAKVYATLFAPVFPSEPIIKDTFRANIVVHDVTDLYGWQVGVRFDRDALVVINVTEGDFLGVKPPLPVWTEDSYINPSGEGAVLIYASYRGQVTGRDGNGTLVTIEFGVVVEGHRELELVKQVGTQKVLILWDSTGKEISNPAVTIEIAS